MLDFFRRYQRYFFVVIAVVIVISFSFFGTHQAINQPEAIEDRCLGNAIDGSKLMKSEVDQMTRFIWSDQTDVALAQKGMIPNFFNDGVIRKDLMSTGMGALLVNAYFEELKDQLQEKMERHKNYRPYVHPTAPFISVENLWAQVLPSQKINLDRFLEESQEMNPDTFSLLVDLYLGETAFPPNILREYLLFQEKNYDWVQPDPALARANLNTFHCLSAEDWFGSRFVELSAQFIINAAAYAKQQGYKVSYEEAHVDIIQKGYEALRVQMRKPEISQEEVGNFWRQQLRNLGMEEKEAIQVWQKIMLFRRLFKDVGGAVFIDPHVYQTFYGFASKSAQLDLYHLPNALELKDFSALMKLEFYLDQVAENRRKGLMLPRNFASLSEIEKSCPELIEERFLIEVAEIEKTELSIDVSLKEMWEWQLKKENYERLEKAFPALAVKKAGVPEEYFATLEGVTPELREKINRFSREKIVENHPEWIAAALNKKEMVVKQVSFYSNGENNPFPGKDLPNLFKVAAIKGDVEENEAAIKARKALEMYSPDGKTYYRFHILDRDLTKAVLTFEEANKRGILDSLLEKHLERAYTHVRAKNPGVFKTDKGEWKPFKEVKNEVGKILYAETLKKIDTEVSKLGIPLSDERFKNLDDFYPKYRLYPYMVVAQKEVRKLRGESQFLGKARDEIAEEKLTDKKALHEQWMLTKEEKVFKNHEKSPWFTSEIFAMVEKSWSEVALSQQGQLQFFQLQEKAVPTGNFSNEMEEGQTILSKEARHCLMGDFLEQLKKQEAIHLDYDSSQRT